MPKSDERFSPAEAAKRRDEVIRRMANTPPQPKIKSHLQENRNKAGAGHAARKGRDDRER